MSMEVAKRLYTIGRSHALASDRLYRAALEDGVDRSPDDPELFAFNGTYSLSIHYLVALGLEVLLKAAYVASGGPSDQLHLTQKIGHDLLRALNSAEERGFRSNAPRLREIVQNLREPYLAHLFRYDSPDGLLLPDFTQMVEALAVLDDELRVLCGPDAS